MHCSIKKKWIDIMSKINTFLEFVKFIYDSFIKENKRVILNNLLLFIGELLYALVIDYSLTILLSIFDSKNSKYLLLYALIVILLYVLTKILRTITEKTNNELVDLINRKAFVHSTKVSYKCLESQEFLKLTYKFQSALNDEECLMSLLNNGIKLALTIAKVIIYSIVLVKFDNKLFVIILFVSFVNYYIYKFKIKNKNKFYKANILINRKYNYYTNVLVENKYAKDYRFSSIGELLINKYKALSDEMISAYDDYLNTDDKLFVFLNFMQASEKLLILLLIVSSNVNLNLRDMVFLLNTVLALNINIDSMFSVSTSFLFVYDMSKSIKDFFDIEEEELSRTNSVFNFNSLSFNNVSFKYPNSTNYSLNNVSFKINKGDKICIVGHNGGGKSTIIKLIARLYRVDQGEIVVNDDFNLDSLNNDSFDKLFSFSFQDSKLLPISLKDNLGQNYDKRKSMYELFDLNDSIAKYKYKEDSLINPYINEDGVELSKGQVQKMINARCILKDSDVMVFDEPSANLDLKSEEKLFKDILNNNKDKTIIYVTHNLAGGKYSDLIFYIKDGNIAESGSFEKLISNHDSLFYKDYCIQRG